MVQWQIFGPFRFHHTWVLRTCWWCHRKIKFWNNDLRHIYSQFLDKRFLMILWVFRFGFDTCWFRYILVWLKWTQISCNKAVAVIIASLVAWYIFLNKLIKKSSFLLWSRVVSVPIAVLALLNFQFTKSMALRLIEEMKARITGLSLPVIRLFESWWILGIVRNRSRPIRTVVIRLQS